MIRIAKGVIKITPLKAEQYYTLKQLPPTNSLNKEFFDIPSDGIGKK